MGGSWGEQTCMYTDSAMIFFFFIFIIIIFLHSAIMLQRSFFFGGDEDNFDHKNFSVFKIYVQHECATTKYVRHSKTNRIVIISDDPRKEVWNRIYHSLRFKARLT